MRLHHAIEVNAPREKVYQVLTDIQQMAVWHKGSVSGEIAPGAEFHLQTENGLDFGWRTEHLIANRELRQLCVNGPGSSAGKRLLISLEDKDNGTLIALSDGEWREDDPHLPLCNTHWAGVLHNLKTVIENREVTE
ncbi:SRPBCC domain-containing protein [Kalamiella sp. sgz302252]|uniref:SRPBCC family protein n=1 Tax=Pantoea sp. sgz302252 TaxID=3341827 RepID=UPI0036D3340A